MNECSWWCGVRGRLEAQVQASGGYCSALTLWPLGNIDPVGFNFPAFQEKLGRQILRKNFKLFYNSNRLKKLIL